LSDLSAVFLAERSGPDRAAGARVAPPPGHFGQTDGYAQRSAVPFARNARCLMPDALTFFEK
jgi:hypothetical protein